MIQEPEFVLRGGDRHAPLLVNLYGLLCALDGSPDSTGPCIDTANAMVEYQAAAAPDVMVSGIRAAVHAVVALAETAGAVVTVEQVALQPFAMGHYETEITVRPKRVPA